MATCPRCHQPVDIEAISCSHCNYTLKAYGHPGIPLHQTQGETYLCDTCVYHEDDTCDFPQRPYAKTCTLYKDKLQPAQVEANSKTSPSLGYQIQGVKLWLQRNRGLVLLLVVIFISLILALN